jgi:uncharacterized protein
MPGPRRAVRVGVRLVRMEMTEHAPGTPSWVDLGSPDIDGSVAFYEALLGWTATEPGPVEETGGYRMFELRGRPVAGVGPQQAPGPPYWTTYFTVASADDTAAAVHDAGGTVMVEPMEILTAGRMAVCADSAGAPFSVWEPREHIGAGIVNEPSSICWNELYTRDADEAAAFYGEVLGLRLATSDAGTAFELDGRPVAGLVLMDDTERYPDGVPAHWIVYFAVADCDAALARAEELGALDTGDPTDSRYGRYAMVTDPQGAIFSVITLSDATG